LLYLYTFYNIIRRFHCHPCEGGFAELAKNNNFICRQKWRLYFSTNDLSCTPYKQSIRILSCILLTYSYAADYRTKKEQPFWLFFLYIFYIFTQWPDPFARVFTELANSTYPRGSLRRRSQACYSLHSEFAISQIIWYNIWYNNLAQFELPHFKVWVLKPLPNFKMRSFFNSLLLNFSSTNLYANCILIYVKKISSVNLIFTSNKSLDNTLAKLIQVPYSKWFSALFL